MIQRAEGDSILAERLGLRKDIPRQLFQQLIAKASDDVRQRLQRERPAMVDQIQSSVAEVAGELQSKFGPVSRSYFVAKRVVATQHRLGNLNENSISGYARAHKIEEVTIGLSLLCALPADVIERALFDKNREMLLILAKALDFSWATTMALLFLGAKDHRVTAKELRDPKPSSAASLSRPRAAFWNSTSPARMPGARLPVPNASPPCDAARDDGPGLGCERSAMNVIPFVAPGRCGGIRGEPAHHIAGCRVDGSRSRQRSRRSRHRRDLPTGDRREPRRHAPPRRPTCTSSPSISGETDATGRHRRERRGCSTPRPCAGSPPLVQCWVARSSRAMTVCPTRPALRRLHRDPRVPICRCSPRAGRSRRFVASRHCNPVPPCPPSSPSQISPRPTPPASRR